MSEQNIMPTEIQPETTEPVSPTPMVEKPKRVRATKKTNKSVAKKGPAKPKTDEEKRLRRNAALREWRKKNAERFRAYMSAWKERKKKTAKTARAKKAAVKKGAARE